MTKVVQLQFSTSSGGSTAQKLHKAFQGVNIHSSIISLHPDINDDEWTISMGRKARLIAKLDHKAQTFLTRNIVKKYGNFIYPVLGTNVSKLKAIKDADFIYLHWILNGFLSLKNIKQLAKLKKPIIIFLHDMWPVTGGCQHSFDCIKYQSKCENCQMFPNHKRNDLSTKGFKKKMKLYTQYKNIFFVSPSKWIQCCASQSALIQGKRIFQIPNPVNNSIFKPIDKKVARHILNIEISETIIAFGAISINSPYKGWEYLKKALQLLHQNEAFNNISVLIFGGNPNHQIENDIPFKTKFVGYLNDQYSTALVYNAANVFVAPSLADTFPSTVREALCCGTPVTGFDIGGISELIEHKKNGYLAKYKNEQDLAAGIQFCLTRNIKGYQPEGLDSELIIMKHLALFDHLKIGNNNGRPPG